jgi:glyoxylase-like metal-dependent hydrolase (beta-lactamase superfamily II)
MKKTLSTIILKLADELVVLPGHGKETTIGRERKNNEFLHERFLKER